MDNHSTATYAKVHNITTEFEWERVDYLLGLPSQDFGPEGLLVEENQNRKRFDFHQKELIEDIDAIGFLDPIFVHCVGEYKHADNKNTTEVLGNGHHRLVAALDLGYTFVPVTRNPQDQRRDSGMSSRGWEGEYIAYLDEKDRMRAAAALTEAS
ncbi:hypothetical protein [Streptomyces sp. LARHCF252]